MALNGHILKILFRYSSTIRPTNNRIIGVGASLLNCRRMSQNDDGVSSGKNANAEFYKPGRKSPVQATTSEWKKQLTDEQFHVCREKGTESAFSGAHCSTNLPGIYNCVCCGANLFKSADKFESRCGWPSFTRPIVIKGDDGEELTNIKEQDDSSHKMRRTEVLCKQCDAHLGHVFPDGPPPTGLRYCINSIALQFEEKGKKTNE